MSRPQVMCEPTGFTHSATRSGPSMKYIYNLYRRWTAVIRADQNLGRGYRARSGLPVPVRQDREPRLRRPETFREVPENLSGESNVRLKVARTWRIEPLGGSAVFEMTGENIARLLRGLTIAVGNRKNRILLYQFLAAEIRALHYSYGVGDSESYRRALTFLENCERLTLRSMVRKSAKHHVEMTVNHARRVLSRALRKLDASQPWEMYVAVYPRIKLGEETVSMADRRRARSRRAQRQDFGDFTDRAR